MMWTKKMFESLPSLNMVWLMTSSVYVIQPKPKTWIFNLDPKIFEKEIQKLERNYEVPEPSQSCTRSWLLANTHLPCLLAKEHGLDCPMVTGTTVLSFWVTVYQADHPQWPYHPIDPFQGLRTRSAGYFNVYKIDWQQNFSTGLLE